MRGNIFRPTAHARLLARLERLRPDSPRAWGRMTPHQAVCHLSDSFRAILLDRPLEPRPLDLRRRLMRVAAFSLPLPWPKGVRTSSEVDAEKGGTRPAVFESDVGELEDLLARFVATDGCALERHYAWGDLTRGEWGRYAYRHVDHHLRQFGV